jgi:DNA modification methylase
VSVRILVGDARAVLATLPAESVHCVVTSPPYWGLRDYGLPPTVWGGEEGCAHAWGVVSRAGQTGGDGTTSSLNAKYGDDGRFHPDGHQHPQTAAELISGSCTRCNAWRGALGLEPTPEAYVAHLVEVFRAVRRVLRNDGTAWCNLGDSYATGTSADRVPTQHAQHGYWENPAIAKRIDGREANLKPKDLVGIPWRVAFALQADGWYLRSEIIWAKPNPMPESVTDRPTKAHEQLFLLAKSPRYFYDAEAIREAAEYGYRDCSGPARSDRLAASTAQWRGVGTATEAVERGAGTVSGKHPETGRNKRSVWTIPSAPFSEAHFATFPPALVEPCVKAGTSERGACPACGAPWGRVVEKVFKGDGSPVAYADRPEQGSKMALCGREFAAWKREHPDRTLGWAPTCACGAGLAPGVVEPCVQAGTSARGACPACGAPWRREVEREGGDTEAMDRPKRTGGMDSATSTLSLSGAGSKQWAERGSKMHTLGWAPTCACAPDPPPGLVEPCVQAGTSERGCCANCGAPWRREFETDPAYRAWAKTQRFYGPGGLGSAFRLAKTNSRQAPPKGHTTGWAPTCACAPDPKPCVVLDPFSGAGTVGLVADRLGRDAILIELKPEYAAMAERRIREEAPLLTAVAVEAASPPASDNGHGALAPEQLILL